MYHVYEDVTNHDHALSVIVPCLRVEGLEKVIVQRRENIFSHFLDQMLVDHFAQPAIKFIPMLVQHHCVGVAVELFEGEAGVVLF